MTATAPTAPLRQPDRFYIDGEWVDAKSIVKVMGLKLRTGTVLELQARGEGGGAPPAALQSLVERNFDEAAVGS